MRARAAGYGLLLSGATHVALLIGAVALGARGRAPVESIEIALADTPTAEVRQLPLGSLEPAGPPRPRTVAAPRRARRASRATSPAKTEAGPASGDPTASAGTDAPTPAGPATLGGGSPHQAVLVRLDRLRGTGYEGAADQLLMYLPERRSFLQGTGLDLWADFDELLVATPDAGNPSLTLLAARHHLAAADLRAALTRGAESTDRTLVWRAEPARLVGERRAREAPPGAADGSEDRTITLFDAGLAVIAPPSYRRLLSGKDAASPGDATTTASPGADGGDWDRVPAAVAAEEARMPAGAVARFEAVGLFAPALSPTDPDSRLWGLDLPPSVSGAIGLADSPFIDVEAELANESQALAWQARWPEVRRQLGAHPYAAAWPGLSPLIRRATLTREENVIRVHVSISPGEARWLLGVALKALADHGA